MLRKIRICLVSSLFIIMCLLTAIASAAKPASISKAEINLTCALVSLASYEDEIGEFTRNWLKDDGWNFTAQENINRLAAGRFHFWDKQLVNGESFYILAFPGTERMKDVAVDLRTSRVPFGGQNIVEFNAVALDKSKAVHNFPLVHGGFNDYTTAAIFSEVVPEYNLTAGEVIADKLKSNPNFKLCLTGHSLGGAAATLSAARLIDMGVKPEQLTVITFGAPAVGNQAFADKYADKLSLTRITINADPVKSVLQSLSKGFVQFGDKESWQERATKKKFPHAMTVYLDEAIRNYYDDTNSNALLPSTPQVNSGRLQIAPLDLQLTADLTKEKSYVQKVLTSLISTEYTNTVAGDENYDYLLVRQLKGERIKNEKDNYRLELAEIIYDNKGNILQMQSHSTTLQNLSVLEAAAYLHHQGKAVRQKTIK